MSNFSYIREFTQPETTLHKIMRVGIRAEEAMQERKYDYALMNCRKLIENYLNEILTKQNITLIKANGYRKDLNEKCDDLEKTGTSNKMLRALKKIRLECNDAVHKLDDPTPEEALRVLQYTYDFVSISFDWYFAPNHQFKQKAFNPSIKISNQTTQRSKPSQTSSSSTPSKAKQTPTPNATPSATKQNIKHGALPLPPSLTASFDDHWQWWLSLSIDWMEQLMKTTGFDVPDDHSVLKDKTIMKPCIEKILATNNYFKENNKQTTSTTKETPSPTQSTTKEKQSSTLDPFTSHWQWWLDLSTDWQKLLMKGAGYDVYDNNILANKTIIKSYIEKILKLVFFSLWDNKLNDISPLKNLTNLKTLILPNSDISDIYPLKNLENLRELNLCHNQISNISPLKNLTNLDRLDLSENQISDISPLKKLTNLQFLFLYKNPILDIFHLENLTNLEGLILAENQISDISFLKNLTNLEELILSDNQISDIFYLKSLTKLETLSLAKNQISDISPLKKLTNLENLDLSENGFSDISPLKNLTNLENLFLWDTQTSDISPLKNLTNLENLDLSKNPISDISPLKNLTNLKKLELKNCPISSTNLQEIKFFLPDTEIIF